MLVSSYFGWSIIVACSQRVSSLILQTNFKLTSSPVDLHSNPWWHYSRQGTYLTSCSHGLSVCPDDYSPRCNVTNTSHMAVNISVCIYPIEAMPRFYGYGYAAPLYYVSRSIRTIVFGTKSHSEYFFPLIVIVSWIDFFFLLVGLAFGVLLTWTAISCISLPLIQWYVRRRSRRWQASPETESNGTKITDMISDTIMHFKLIPN